MKSALVVFTKVPKENETKTRLTTNRGGIFTPEEAKSFYEACLLDVIDSSIAAACCEVYICHNQGGDGTYLKQLLKSLIAPQAIKEVFSDAGGSFDCAMQYAADYILKNGEANRLADAVIIVGGDMPCLQPRTIKAAVEKLAMLAASKQALACARSCCGGEDVGAAIIESADQAGGFNIIGYTCTTPFDFAGVFYNEEGITVLDAVVQKAAAGDIPISLVEMAPDIDILEDLGGLIPVMNTMKLAKRYDASITLPQRTLNFLREMGIVSETMVVTT